jgi:predicted nucleic acid-binding protein
VTLKEALRGVKRLGIDSSAFIDFAQGNPRSIRALKRIFEHIEGKELEGVTTVLTLTEVLAFARRTSDEGDDLEAGYRVILYSEGIRRAAVDEATALRAADLRERYGLGTPDAIQIATALEAGCQAFLTIDAGDFLRASGELRVIVPQKLAD